MISCTEDREVVGMPYIVETNMCIGVYLSRREWCGICDVTIGTCVRGQDASCSHGSSLFSSWLLYLW